MKMRLALLLCIITIYQNTFRTLFNNFLVYNSDSLLENQYPYQLYDDEHSHDYYHTTVNAPTKIDTSITKLSHKYEGRVYTIVPNCTTEGFSYVNCSRCNEKYIFNATSASDHKYTQIIKQATCTSSGTQKCSNCPATQTTSAIGHAYSGELYTIAPTCTEDGYSYVFCYRCNTEKNIIATTSATGHSYHEIIENPTCTATGTKKCYRCTNTTSIPATEHLYAFYSSDDINHWKSCPECNEISDNEAHKFNSELICTLCNYTENVKFTKVSSN